jgi:hypothetical protein
VSYFTDPSHWALSYLRGRAESFRRGRLTIGNVLGAARKAVALGVSHADVSTLLAEYGLTWDEAGDELRQAQRE